MSMYLHGTIITNKLKIQSIESMCGLHQKRRVGGHGLYNDCLFESLFSMLKTLPDSLRHSKKVQAVLRLWPEKENYAGPL